MYIKNTNENIMSFDVDNTLIFFRPLKGVTPIQVHNGRYMETIYPNLDEIRSLKQAKFRGIYIRVHSQGGVNWAEMIVKALELEEYVDSVETKPKWYHDDLDANEWMDRVYHKPKFEET